MMVIVNTFAICATVGVYFIDKEITISMYHGLTFLNIILTSFLAFSGCFLYYFVYKSFKYNFDPDYLQNLVRKFQKFIEEYMIFLNFEDNIKNITYLLKNAKPKNKMYNKY